MRVIGTVAKVAAAIGVLLLLTRKRGAACTDTAQCGAGKICWKGKCVDRGVGAVTFIDEELQPVTDNVAKLWAVFGQWVDGDANDGPITRPSQVDDSLNPFNLE